MFKKNPSRNVSSSKIGRNFIRFDKQTLIHQRIFFEKNPLSKLILWQNSCFYHPPSLQFHNRTDTITHIAKYDFTH